MARSASLKMDLHLDDIDKLIESKASVFMAGESWPMTIATEVNKQCRQLRSDIQPVSDYYECCSILAFHYSSWGTFNWMLLLRNVTDPESVKLFLQSLYELLESTKEEYAVGNIEHLGLELRRIVLLRIIEVLENTLIAPKQRLAWLKTEQQTNTKLSLNLDGKPELSKLYMNTSLELWNLVLSEKNKGNSSADKKQRIEDNIRNGIKENRSVTEIKENIEHENNESLGPVDHVYIDSKYVEYCVHFWIEETRNCLKMNPANNDVLFVKNLVDKVGAVQNLEGIPSPFKQGKYFKILLGHCKFVSEKDKLTYVSMFKAECWKHISDFTGATRQELTFIEALNNCLCTAEDYHSIISELKLEDFLDRALPFEELINNILQLDEAEKYKDVKNAAVFFKEKKALCLITHFKSMLVANMKPVHVGSREVGGRFVLEVIGRNIALALCLKQIETILKNASIEEVRFIAGYIMHINTNLKGDIWCGKNIVVYTKMIKVHGNVTWDVSAKDNSFIHEGNAGMGEDGHGKQGADGSAGASGGNVLIVTQEMENADKFTIKSNGGKGGKGQDGGNGQDGQDGTGITQINFKKLFPPVVKWDLYHRLKRVTETLKNINENSTRIVTAWIPGKGRQSLGEFIETLERRISNKESHSLEDMFIKAVTKLDYEITFSLRGTGSASLYSQAFLVCEGSKGKRGEVGGNCGLGGPGGYGGEITINISSNARQKYDVKKLAEPGQNGANGQGGLYGKHGGNGWDMGYIDWLLWSESSVRYYGINENSKLIIKYHDTSESDRIYCPYKYYDGSKDVYIGITVPQVEFLMEKEHEEQIENNDRISEKQAQRRKAISQESIEREYHQYFCCTETTLQDIQSNMEAAKQRALQAIEEVEDEEVPTLELKLKLQMPCTRPDIKRPSHPRSTAPRNIITTRVRPDVQCVIDDLGNQSSVEDWLHLKDLELNFSQVNDLLKKFNQLSPNLSQNKDIEQLLIAKYRTSTLHEIAKQISPDRGNASTSLLSAECIVKYLVEAKENDNSISNSNLGNLNQYIYSIDRKVQSTLSKYCHHIKNDNNKYFIAFKHSFKFFIIHVGRLVETYPAANRCYIEYKQFLKQREIAVRMYLDCFERELSKKRYSALYLLWLESLSKDSNQSLLQAEIDKDPFLRGLYYRYKSKAGSEFNWINYSNYNVVVNEFVKHITENGFVSPTYREFLALVFDVNIRFYMKDVENQFVLLDNHNSSCEQTLHILYSNKEFIQLTLDEDYLKLEGGRNLGGKMCAQILTDTEQIQVKTYFDEYLKGKRFVFDNGTVPMEEVIDEEDAMDRVLQYFHSPEEKLQVEELLDKVSSRYIGSQAIVRNILKSFSIGGCHITCEEFGYLVNLILYNITENKIQLSNLCWIISAYPQQNWIDELLLMYIENQFRKALPPNTKYLLREYLAKIEDKDTLMLFKVKLEEQMSRGCITLECVVDTLYLLSKTPEDKATLQGLGLSEWSYTLEEQYLIHQLSQLMHWDSVRLETASLYILSLKNASGYSLVNKLLKMLQKTEFKLSPEILVDILASLYTQKQNLSQEHLLDLSTQLNAQAIHNTISGQWKVEMLKCFVVAYPGNERNVEDLITLITSNANTTEGIITNLPTIKEFINKLNVINAERCLTYNKSAENKQVEVPSTTFSTAQPFQAKEQLSKEIQTLPETIRNFKEKNLKKWLIKFKMDYQGTTFNEAKGMHEEMLAVIIRGIEITRDIRLRDTQILTIVTLLSNERNMLAQVSTGEGKTLIIVAVAAMKALCGEMVDVVTSSRVLARRDAASEPPKGNSDIYNLLGINVAHNCSEDIGKRKEAYSGNQVVYGDLSNFQRDYLLHTFHGKNILGDRKCENVIIDEVDSMLLDKGNNMLYLSHDIPCLDKLVSVYIFIWQWINMSINKTEDLHFIFNTTAIKEAVLDDIFVRIKKRDLKALDSKFTTEQVDELWNLLIASEVVDGEGKLLKQTTTCEQLGLVLPATFSTYEDRLHYLLEECVERRKRILVPNYLKPFIEQHLEAWVKNALKALFMKEGHDYVVDVDRTGTHPDLNPNITILDRDTGADQANSQWDEALHQFLQLKHGCKISPQSLKAVFISNVTFFKKYTHLYGLTGTLGSQVERNILSDIHDVDFVTIPTSRYKQFDEISPVICNKQGEWIQKIITEAETLTLKKKRSVLIICETVDDVETLYEAFGGNKLANVYAYKRDYDEFEVTQGNKELKQGQIIIATNLAGRGTDIKISKGLELAGGLHVCLTYFPDNIRIEEQAFGRAARKGEKGSGQLIVVSSNGHELGSPISRMFSMKKQRNKEELQRISDIKTYYESQIQVEEVCFKLFQKWYEELREACSSARIPEKVKEILLQSCLNKWAFWLDRNSHYIKKLTDEEITGTFHSSFNDFIMQLMNLKCDEADWPKWVSDPIDVVELAKYLAQNDKHNLAIDLFDQVIAREPLFSEAAHYYKAFALVKKGGWEQDGSLQNELQQAAKLFVDHNMSCVRSAAIIGSIKKSYKGIIQIDAFTEQQETLSKMYTFFLDSIDDILGHCVTPQSFVTHVVEEELAEDIFKDLLSLGILENPRVLNISKEHWLNKDLARISKEYGIGVEELRSFLSGWRGGIDIEKFRRQLKKQILIPSREQFWKILIQEGILVNEEQFIWIDNKKLTTEQPSLRLLIENLQLLESSKILLPEERIAAEDSVTVNKILLYEDQVGEGEDNVIVRKQALIEAVGKEKYKVLKKKGVFTSNKCASIDATHIESAVLPLFDYITLQDFIKANIVESEAKLILEELVRQNILNKEYSRLDEYRLGYQMKHIQLPAFPLYEDVVNSLLSLCFSYRLALQELEKDQRENARVKLRLMPRPHLRLYWELMEHRVMSPVQVTRKAVDVELMMIIYSRTVGEHCLMCMFSESGLPFEEQVKHKLLGHLVQRKWLNLEVNGDPEGNIYYINSLDQRQPLDVAYKGMEDTVKLILGNRLKLSKNVTVRTIVSLLQRLRGSVTTFKYADCSLRPITNLSNFKEFANIEEIHMFSLNGLSHVLLLNEKRWAFIMFQDALTLLLVGVCQVAVGIAGRSWLFNPAITLLSGGIDNIMLGIRTLLPSQLEWAGYLRSKLSSILNIILEASGIAFNSLFANRTRLGSAVTGSSLQDVTEYGSVLTSRVRRELVTQIAVKTTKGITFSLLNAGFHMLVEKNIIAICDYLVSEIMSRFEIKVETETAMNLREVYDALGKVKAKRSILGDNVFSGQAFIHDLIEFATGIAETLGEGMTEELITSRAGTNKFMLPFEIIKDKHDSLVSGIETVVNNILSNLNQEMKKHNIKDPQYNEISSDGEFQTFKNEVINEWKFLLRNKSEETLLEHIAAPILKTHSDVLRKGAGKHQGGFQHFDEMKNLEEFEQLKTNYEATLQPDTDDCYDPSQVKQHDAQEKNEAISKLLSQFKYRNLLNAVILEFSGYKMISNKSLSNKLIKDQMKEMEGNCDESSYVVKRLKELDADTTEYVRYLVGTISDGDLKKCVEDILQGRQVPDYTTRITEGDRRRVVCIIHLENKRWRKLISFLMKGNTSLSDVYNVKDLEASRKSTFVTIQRMNRSTTPVKGSGELPHVLNVTSRVAETSAEHFHFERVAVASRGGVLYVACNYQVWKGEEDAVCRADSTYTSGDELHHYICENSVRNMFQSKTKKDIVFIEPEEKLTDVTETKVPHAEMQLLAFSEQIGISFDRIHVTKPPCIPCVNMMIAKGIKCYQHPGSSVNPTDWEHPDQHKMEVRFTSKSLPSKPQYFQLQRIGPVSNMPSFLNVFPCFKGSAISLRLERSQSLSEVRSVDMHVENKLGLPRMLCQSCEF